MKKLIIILGLLLMGCQSHPQEVTTEAVVTEATAPVESEIAETESTEQEQTEALAATEIEILGQDFMPSPENNTVYFEGSKNFSLHPEYSDGTRVQMVQLNGDEEPRQYLLTVEEPGVFLQVMTEETYFRQNLLLMKETEYENELDMPFLLIPTVVQEGETWESGGAQFKIVDADTQKVTIEKVDDKNTVFVFEKGKGIVEVTVTGDETEQVKAVNTAVSNPERSMNLYYPDPDDDAGQYLLKHTIRYSFKTNEITRETLPTLIAESAKEGYFNYLPEGSKINWLYKDKEDIVHVDFNQVFQDNLQTGSTYEVTTLESIAMTLLDLMDGEELLLTVEGNHYEGGHVTLEKGETIDRVEDEYIR